MKPDPTLTSRDRFSCLLVDDDAGLSGMFAKIVAEEGGQPCVCHTLAAARAEIEKRTFDLAILDNRLPDGTGYEFHPQLMRKSPASVVVMITGAPELAQAIELTRNGLFDYLTKPISADSFTALVRRARLRLSRPEPDPGAIVLAGTSSLMGQAVQELQQAAPHVEATVLLLGETGTGKDLAARMLHQMTYGERAAALPYIAVNCPGVPAEIFEAELFGSEKGAYTGADRRRTGLVEAAEGGTLFLDEVAEIPLALQSKLLRFLESREYRSIGGTTTRRFTGRVVAATNRSLDAEVSAGRFREDLKYRLDVLSTHLPPLREHPADIEPISEALLTQLCEKYERRKPKLRPTDVELLRRHTFPGNVRELRNLLERSLLRADPESTRLEIDLAWLKGHVQSRDRSPRQSGAEAGEGAFGSAERSSPPARPELSSLERQEYDLIARTLSQEDGAIRRAAAKLGLTHQALLRRLQKWPELRQPKR